MTLSILDNNIDIEQEDITSLIVKSYVSRGFKNANFKLI